MAERGAIQVREESPEKLNDALKRCRSEAHSMELRVSRKEAELRRAKEEQAILQELRTMNAMIVRKREQKQSDVDSRGYLKISPESLTEFHALEDEIRLANKQTAELQDVANSTSRQMEEVEKALESKSGLLAVVKRATGWEADSLAARSGNFTGNELAERKKALAALCEEQQTVKDLTDRLTEEIEKLTLTAEEYDNLDELFAATQDTFDQHNKEYQSLLEEEQSFERLAKKKERLLNTTRKTDPYKVIRHLEGDKKVLHNNLSSLRETNNSNSKSILSLEVRLRQLETRLEAVNLFLKQVFAEVENDEPMENIPEDAQEVPLVQFEELSQELDLSRQTVLQRDDQLNAHDAKVEQLERKVDILRGAITSRAVSSQLQSKEKKKEFGTLMSHVQQMKTEFEEEYLRLSSENTMLRRKMAQL